MMFAVIFNANLHSAKGRAKGKKNLQNLFQLRYDHKPKSNVPLRKNHKTSDRKFIQNIYKLPSVITIFHSSTPRGSVLVWSGWKVRSFNISNLKQKCQRLGVPMPTPTKDISKCYPDKDHEVH